MPSSGKFDASGSRMAPGKQIVPAQPCGQTGTKRGWEHATLSFPVPALGAWWLPASRRYSPRPAEFVRPRSRAVQRLARAEFRVRPLGSLGLAVAPPARKPGQDTPVISFPRLDHLAPGRPPLLAVRWPGATGLTSYLSGCLSLTSQRCVLKHRRRSGSSAGPALARVLPGIGDSFCPPFGVFGSAGFKPPERSVPCWRTVATIYLSG
jgi:hypothetical protein